MPHTSTPPGRTQSVGTFAAIRRLYPYAKPAMPRVYLGMVSALLAGVVALLIQIGRAHV